MLVLTRKIGEQIVIGDDIKIKIVEVKGKQVRVGIEYPGQQRSPAIEMPMNQFAGESPGNQSGHRRTRPEQSRVAFHSSAPLFNEPY